MSMRTIFFILQKEFIQILRNRTMLPLIIILPFVQLLILVNAATFDMKNIDLYVVDKDLSTTSRQLVTKFEASPFYHLENRSFNVEEGQDFTASLNPESLDILQDCKLEPALKHAEPGITYQFERQGYFCPDNKDSSQDKPVFNRTVPLRDAWAKIEKMQAQKIGRAHV